MSPIITMALAGFTEARRNRVTLIVVAFAIVLLLSTTFVIGMTVFTIDRVATDFGLGVMSLLMIGLSVFLSSTQLSREIDRRTIFLVLCRPLSRAQFVIGRTLGTLLTLWAMLAAMALLFFAQARTLHIDLTPAQLASVLGLAVELVFMTSLGALLSSVSGPMVSSLCSIGVYLIGHGTSDLWDIAARSKSETIQVLGKAAYWALPQLFRLDYKLAAAYALPVDWAQFGTGAAYALAYSGILLYLAITAFDRVDFK